MFQYKPIYEQDVQSTFLFYYYKVKRYFLFDFAKSNINNNVLFIFNILFCRPGSGSEQHPAPTGEAWGGATSSPRQTLSHQYKLQVLTKLQIKTNLQVQTKLQVKRNYRFRQKCRFRQNYSFRHNYIIRDSGSPNIENRTQWRGRFKVGRNKINRFAETNKTTSELRSWTFNPVKKI